MNLPDKVIRPDPEICDDPATEMQLGLIPQKDESVPLSSQPAHVELTDHTNRGQSTEANDILLKYNIGDIGREEDMEECRDLLPILTHGDIVFFWKGHDIWKLAMFDEVIEDGRYAFLPKVDPYQRLKLTPDRLWRYINFPHTVDKVAGQSTTHDSSGVGITSDPSETDGDPCLWRDP